MFLPRQSYRLPLGVNVISQKKYKLQVTSESQDNILIVYHFLKYSTTTYSLPVSLQKFTSWIFLQILYTIGYQKHEEPMVIMTIRPW